MRYVRRHLKTSLCLLLAVFCYIPAALSQGCNYVDWMTYEGVRLSHLPDHSAYLYQTSHAAIDADGAPNAYNPSNTGIDFNANAGLPDHWHNVIAADPHDPGKPFVQTQGEFAGYFVSKSTLMDKDGDETSPATYADAHSIPYLVFPGNFYRAKGSGLMGDIGVAVNRSSGRTSSFIVADLGNAADRLGEMSVALAEALSGVKANPRNGAGAPAGDTLYIVFPYSSRQHPPRWPLSRTDIDHDAQALLAAAGGRAAAEACR